jgi:hypothetical protein
LFDPRQIINCTSFGNHTQRAPTKGTTKEQLYKHFQLPATTSLIQKANWKKSIE